MCEYMIRLIEVLTRMNGQGLENYFPHHTTNRFGFLQIQQGYCFNCGKWMHQNELNPPGRTTRSLCSNCYEVLISSVPVHNCIICGDSLPQNKIYNQQIQNREIANYMHDGFCRDYFTLIHSKVNGALQLQNQHYIPAASPQPLITHDHRNDSCDNFLENSNSNQFPKISYSNSPTLDLAPVLDNNLQFWQKPKRQPIVNNGKRRSFSLLPKNSRPSAVGELTVVDFP